MRQQQWSRRKTFFKFCFNFLTESPNPNANSCWPIVPIVCPEKKTLELIAAVFLELSRKRRKSIPIPNDVYFSFFFTFYGEQSLSVTTLDRGDWLHSVRNWPRVMVSSSGVVGVLGVMWLDVFFVVSSSSLVAAVNVRARSVRPSAIHVHRTVLIGTVCTSYYLVLHYYYFNFLLPSELLVKGTD